MAKTELPSDFADLLLALLECDVQFLLVGGYAVAHHGHARATKDIDVWVRPGEDNADRVIRALREFGAPLVSLGVTRTDFVTAGQTVQIGVAPLRIDSDKHRGCRIYSCMDGAAALRSRGPADSRDWSHSIIGEQAGRRTPAGSARRRGTRIRHRHLTQRLIATSSTRVMRRKSWTPGPFNPPPARPTPRPPPRTP